MKYLKISLMGLVLAVTPVFASAIHVDSIVKAIVDSFISWKSDTIDVGQIPKDKPKKIGFEFTNNSAKPVLITHVKASCGCTATDYTKTPIEPGQKGYVNASYNAANVGAFNKTVTVTTSDSETPKKLIFKGVVVQ